LNKKQNDAFELGINQIIGSFILILGLIYNKKILCKTDNDIKNHTISSSDFVLYIDINAIHRLEFEEMFKDKLYINIGGNINNVTSQSRGVLFKKYIENKLNIPNVSILRIDLVFDNECMINMLELRGHAVKV
jgi:hypothetical protein